MKEEIKNLILNGIKTAPNGIYEFQDLQTYFLIRRDSLNNYKEDFVNAVNELIDSGAIQMINLSGRMENILFKAAG